jgi:hypothetical protein
MASSKISELVDGGSFLPGDDTIIVRNGANFKVDPTINAVNAWVNFNGTGTVAIRASYNVSSITDRGTGQYTVNFTNAMSDANYATSVAANQTCFPLLDGTTPNTTSGVDIFLVNFAGSGGIDKEQTQVAVIR